MKKESVFGKALTDVVALSRPASGGDLLGRFNLKANLEETMAGGKKKKVIGMEERRKRHMKETTKEAT